MSRRILVLLAALALLAAGCGGGSDPVVTADPTPSTSPTTPVVSSSAPPVVETPEDFIRRWQEASAGMQNSGDTTDFAPLNSAKCAACQRLIDLVTQYYAAGGQVSTEPWAISKIESRSKTVYLVRMTAAPTVVVSSAGSSPSKTIGGDGEFVFTLEPVGSSWVVDNFEQQAT